MWCPQLEIAALKKQIELLYADIEALRKAVPSYMRVDLPSKRGQGDAKQHKPARPPPVCACALSRCRDVARLGR